MFTAEGKRKLKKKTLKINKQQTCFKNNQSGLRKTNSMRKRMEL